MFQNRFRKWNKKIWIAKKVGSIENDFGYETPIYTKPKMYKINVQPVSASADIQEFGEKAEQMQRAVIEKNIYFGKFKEFDVAYLDEVEPSDEEGEIIIDSDELKENVIEHLDELEIIEDTKERIKCYSCPNANYRLFPPRNQNKCITLYFERITDK